MQNKKNAHNNQIVLRIRICVKMWLDNHKMVT